MGFESQIKLNDVSTAAEKEFGTMQDRLSKIESRLQMQLNGKTRSRLAGDFAATMAWLAAYGIFCWVIKHYVGQIIAFSIMFACVALILFMLIDDIMSTKYYCAILKHQSAITQLINRLNAGKDSIKTNTESFLSSKTGGWEYPLTMGNSILDEASKIEHSLLTIESFSSGFVNGAKNALYYIVAVAITIVGSIPLLDIAGELNSRILFMWSWYYEDDLRLVCIIALLIVCVGEIFLSKLAWGKTDCAVTNKTLLMTAVGPILFLGFVLVASVLILLLWILVSTVGLILPFVIAIIIIFATMSGTSGG